MLDTKDEGATSVESRTMSVIENVMESKVTRDTEEGSLGVGIKRRIKI